jgi:hypothetical protein
VLAHLLLTAVEGADVGVDIGDLLAVEDRLAVEHAVGPGWCGSMLMNIVFGLPPPSSFTDSGEAVADWSGWRSSNGTVCEPVRS